MCHLLRMRWLLLIVGAVMFTGCGHNTSQNTTPGSMPQLSSSNGPVTMTVNAPLYRASDTIIVTLSNRGSEAISFADHHTNCTVFLLQQRVDGNWKNIENCYLGRPTGCATRLQQASCVVRSGLASNLGHIACLLTTA